MISTFKIRLRGLYILLSDFNPCTSCPGLTVVLFAVFHPGLVAKLMYCDNRLCTLTSKRQKLSESSYATASVLSLGHYGFQGGASLQIENAQLKLHFSSCMLVLSFEWMNILQPTLCVNLFHAFESSIIFEKTSVERPASRRGPISERTLFRVALFELLVPSQMTTYKA